eukprot:214648-Chlamydomonas_euryale.AAC.3
MVRRRHPGGLAACEFECTGARQWRLHVGLGSTLQQAPGQQAATGARAALAEPRTCRFCKVAALLRNIGNPSSSVESIRGNQKGTPPTQVEPAISVFVY